MKRSMLSRRVGSLMLVRESADDPTDAEWDEFLTFLTANSRELQDQRLKILVRTDGGSPNAAQLKRLAATLGKTQALVAIVSDSIKVRFAGAAIALFQRNIRQFSTAEWPRTYAHLGLTQEQQLSAEETLRQLEVELRAAV